MKKILFFTLLIALTSSLQAYSKKIIFATFTSNKNAQKSLKSFQKTSEYKKLSKLSIDNSFQVYVRASGNYFIVVAEPFYDRKIAVQAYKLIKIKYENLYANIYTPPEKQLNNEVEKPLHVEKKIVKVAVKKELIKKKVDTEVQKPETLHVEKKIIKTVVKKELPKKSVEVKIQKTEVQEESLIKTMGFAMDILDILKYLAITLLFGTLTYYFIKFKRIYDEY